MAIDQIDRQLIRLLSIDARTSYADLGSEVGLTAPSVYARVEKLRQSGVIRSYTVDTDPARLGYGLAALISVTQQPGFHWEKLEAAFAAMEPVEACYSVTGEHSYILLVRVTDAPALEDLLRQINGLEGAAGTRTVLILSTTFERRRL